MRTSEKPARPMPATPAAKRLPAPPRERKPALAALGVLLILGGMLATAVLVLQSGDRVSAIGVNDEVAAGQRIPESALVEVQIADTGVPYVRWTDAAAVTKYYAAVDLLPGTLLTNRMVSKTTELGPGNAKVGLALKPGQYPPGLTGSARVQIIHVPPKGERGRVLADRAQVMMVRAGRGGGSNATMQVEVVVPTSAAAEVATYAAAGEVAVAWILDGGEPAGPPPGQEQPAEPDQQGQQDQQNQNQQDGQTDQRGQNNDDSGG